MAHTILIADDSKTIRRVVEIAFARESEYQLVAAGSGEEAIQKAREIRPSLVLADHNMDGKDGYDVAEALIPEGTKVLLLTGSSKDFDEARAAAAGVEKFDKPFDCQSLLEKVAHLVGAEPPAPAPGLRPVGSTPVAVSPKPATPPATPSTPTPATPATPSAPATPPVPQAKPAQAGWQSGGSLAGATGRSEGEAVETAFGGAAKAVAQAAAPAVAAAATPAIQSASNGAAPSEAAISAAAREIIERVVWEVVPELAETLIREEIERLLKR